MEFQKQQQQRKRPRQSQESAEIRNWKDPRMNDDRNERQLKRATRIRNAAEKLISFLDGKSECHEGEELLLNTFDESVKKFVKTMETATELYSEKCLPIINEDLPVPELIRNKSNQLLKEAKDDGRRRVTVSVFVDEIKKTTEKDILRNYDDDISKNLEDYVGLDCDRDTEEEVENILRLFPEVLKEFPDVFWCDRLRDIPFIPLMVRLRIELCDDLEERERGGLLDTFPDPEINDEYLNVLQGIIMAGANIGDVELVEDRLLTTMRRLKDNGHLHKSDIQEFGLVLRLVFERGGNIPEKVFWFLLDWDPELLSSSRYRVDVTKLAAAKHRNCTLKAFQLVFEASIRYFPNEEGNNILFFGAGHQCTIFELACGTYGREEVWKAIESTWIKYSNDPYGFAKKLFIAAADIDIDLDCVYFALRREPGVLAKLLSGNLVTASETVMMEGTNSGNNAATGRNKRKVE